MRSIRFCSERGLLVYQVWAFHHTSPDDAPMMLEAHGPTNTSPRARTWPDPTGITAARAGGSRLSEPSGAAAPPQDRKIRIKRLL